MGDLNLILHRSENLRGKDFDGKEVQFAKDLIQEEGLVDLGFAGHPFTSNNGHVDRAHIKQRLDKRLANANSVTLFPDVNTPTYPW